MEPYDSSNFVHDDLGDPAMDLNENVHLNGLTEFVPLYNIGITIEACKRATVVYEYNGIRNFVMFDLPNVEDVKKKGPKKTNGFLIFKNSLLRELKNLGESLMPHTVTQIAGSVWRATHDDHKEPFLTLANKVMSSIRSDMESTDANTSYYEFVCRHCRRRNRVNRR